MTTDLPRQLLDAYWNAWTAIFTGILVVTGLGALLYAKRQIDTQRDLNQLENLERQVEWFDSEPFIKYRKALARKRIATGKYSPMGVDDAPGEAITILNFFEHLAFLVKRGYIRIYDVWHSFGYWAIPLYFDTRRVIEDQQSVDRSYFSDFVWLHEQLQKEQVRECGSKDIPTDAELFEFFQEEAEDLGTSPRRRKRVGTHSVKKVTFSIGSDELDQ